MELAMKLNFVVALCALFATGALAADVDVKSAWARGTVPAQQVGGVFMELTSKVGAVLVGVTTSVAEDAEVHEMRLEGGVMKMRPAPRLDLPAGQTVSLKPGGYHIMLMGLKQQLKAGETIPLTLKLERKDNKIDSVEVKAEVRGLNASTGEAPHDHMHMH
jgi:copper(I)-binding protein